MSKVNSPCPRVRMRMECPECGYPISEARYELDPSVPHEQEDPELEAMLQQVPNVSTDIPHSPHIGNNNCYVFYDPQLKRLEIFPEEGGWMGVEKEHILADVAPYSD